MTTILPQDGIQVRHPAPHDPVQDQFTVAGLGWGHEAQVAWQLRVPGAGGAVLAEGFSLAGWYLTEFVAPVDVTGVEAPADGRVLLEVFSWDPGDPEPGRPDDGRLGVVSVPLVLAARVVPGYVGYRTHTVQAGDTLSALAREDDVTGGALIATQVFALNRDQLDDPDHLRVGQVLRLPVRQ